MTYYGISSLPDLNYPIAGMSHPSHVDTGIVTAVSVYDLRRTDNQTSYKDILKHKTIAELTVKSLPESPLQSSSFAVAGRSMKEPMTLPSAAS